MKLSLYVDAPSPLHRLHPVTKVSGLLVFVVAAFLVDRPAALAPMVLLAFGLHPLAGTTSTLARFRWMFFMVATFTIVVWTCFYGGRFAPTWYGFQVGCATAMRLEAFLGAGLLFLGVTRVEEVAYALGRLGVPHLVGFTLTLAFRLVPVFFESATTIVQAQRCRGLALERGGVIARLRHFVPVLVPVFIGALRRADHMAMALELRGFNSGRPRTTWLRAVAGGRDAVAAMAYLALLGVYVWVWQRGLGAMPQP